VLNHVVTTWLTIGCAKNVAKINYFTISRLRVDALQVALLRVPPLVLAQEPGLVPDLVPAPFPPQPFYAVWPLVPPPVPY